MDQITLIRHLDRRLSKSLTSDATCCAIRRRYGSIGLDDFLVGCFIRYRRRMSRFFKDAELLDKMANDLYPFPRPTLNELMQQEILREGLPEHELATVTTAIVIDLEPQLAGLLGDAVKLAITARRRKAELDHFVAALALDDATIQRLYFERGLVLKGLDDLSLY